MNVAGSGEKEEKGKKNPQQIDKPGGAIFMVIKMIFQERGRRKRVLNLTAYA